MGRPKYVREGLTVSVMRDELGDAEGEIDKPSSGVGHTVLWDSAVQEGIPLVILSAVWTLFVLSVVFR